MPLSNSQYEEIMREYDKRQLANRRILEDRRREVNRKIPRIGQIDAAIASSTVQKTRMRLEGDSNAQNALKAELSALSQERAKLLQEAGYPADYLHPVYTCPDCKDTGYIGSRKCHCFQQAIINTVYAQSNIRQVLTR